MVKCKKRIRKSIIVKDAKEKAEQLVRKFAIGGWGKKNALTCVEVILEDLRESYALSDGLHPHTVGMFAGSIVVWSKIKKELEKL